MHVKEILNRTPPAILYRYTTQRGLLGIISSKEIWATHTQYLNDAREFRHAGPHEKRSGVNSKGAAL